ncbi:MAG: hypothetical protein WC194_12545 [Mesotoga sp.]|uniref:hypothetical protein n=1 Tax=Mesotoga sp. TaxID=2053577 RepID=UPI00356953B7
MNDQEIRDLSTILVLYENLSANQNRTQDEQDNLDMAEYILFQSIKPLLEEVKRLKGEGNKPMDDFKKTAIDLASSLGHLFHSLPKECQDAYEAFQKAYIAEIGKKIPGVAVDVEIPLIDEFKKDIPEFREELEKRVDELGNLLHGFNTKYGELFKLSVEMNFKVEEV